MPPKGAKAPPKAAGKKGGPNAAMLMKLKQHMEQQKEEEERLAQEAAEEERRLREEDRLAEEQRKFEEEERQRERKAAKENERQQRKERKGGAGNDALSRMRAAGFIVPDVEKIRTEASNEPVAPKPKPKPKPKTSSAPAVPARPPTPSESSEDEDEDDVDGAEVECVEPTESDAELDEDDWEAEMEREERRVARHERNLRIVAANEERAAAKERRKTEAKQRRLEEKQTQNHVLEKVANLRSPISCVLGHVDTGKTSLLDKIRSSDVQGGEAGGITQQIGATFFPHDALFRATEELNKKRKYPLDVPGLLVIDTPGHESFTNLRSRGSSLCDIAILVVNIMHGLEQQTRESLRLLRGRKCPFIIALNKVDRLYDWEPHQDMGIEETLELQKPYVRQEFDTRVKNVQEEMFAEGVNSDLYYKNDDVRKVVSIVPTSAKSGEGVCDLLLLEIKLVQDFMEDKVTFKDDLQCTILEVKHLTGYGFTLDAILINGTLNEGDSMCLCGQHGPIFTQIRSLMTPQPMKELRLRSDYVHHKTIKAAIGIKIAGNDLEHVIPGTSLVILRKGDDPERAAKEVMKDANSLSEHLSPDGIGVTVQSSTLGSLEAILTFLNEENTEKDKARIPVAHAAVGTLHKRHILRVLSMQRKDPRYAVILAFDVEISADAREIAKKNSIEIFQANIIYHLFDQFLRYMADYERREKERLRAVAVFPVQLSIADDAIHNKDPIILPMRVERGQLRPGTPLCVVRSEGSAPLMIGKVMSMERDGKSMTSATTGQECSVKINSAESDVTFGRQFSKSDQLVSHITRPSVDAVKKFKDELSEDDINLLATLIKVLKVPK